MAFGLTKPLQFVTGRIINLFESIFANIHKLEVPKHLMAFCLSLSVGWKVARKHVVIAEPLFC